MIYILIIIQKAISIYIAKRETDFKSTESWRNLIIFVILQEIMRLKILRFLILGNKINILFVDGPRRKSIKNIQYKKYQFTMVYNYVKLITNDEIYFKYLPLIKI